MVVLQGGGVHCAGIDGLQRMKPGKAICVYVSSQLMPIVCLFVRIYLCVCVCVCVCPPGMSMSCPIAMQAQHTSTSAPHLRSLLPEIDQTQLTLRGTGTVPHHNTWPHTCGELPPAEALDGATARQNSLLMKLSPTPPFMFLLQNS